jgi:hypothetical protein
MPTPRTLASLTLRLAAWCCSLAGIAILALWLLAQLITDSIYLFQFIFWTPGWAAGFAALALSFIAGMLALFARALKRPRAANQPHPRRRVTLLVGIARLVFIAGAILVLVSHASLRAAVGKAPKHVVAQIPAPTSPQDNTRGLRIIQWNLTRPGPWEWSGSIDSLGPAAHNNATNTTDPASPWADLYLLSSTMPAAEFARFAEPLADSFAITRWGSFAFISRVPIVEARWFSLGIDSIARPSASTTTEAAQQQPARFARNGTFERLYNRIAPPLGISRRSFDTAEDGTLIVLLVQTQLQSQNNTPGTSVTDTLAGQTHHPESGGTGVSPVPNGPEIPQKPDAPATDHAFTRDAAASSAAPLVVYFIDLPSNPLLPRIDVARHVAARLAALRDEKDRALPPPDIIIGDFNIPAGSASLDLIRGSLLNARPPGTPATPGTWPRARPMLKIDHCFIHPRLRANSWMIADPGVSDHWYQAIELVATP